MAPKPGKWFGRLANRIGRIFTGRQPEAPPTYYEPEPEPTPVPLGGQLYDYDEEPYEDQLPYEEVYEDEGPYVEEPVSTDFLDWEPEDDDVTLLDANNEVIGSMSKETWFDELLEGKEYIQQTYGYSHEDLIAALERAGQWDAEDWRQWRELYDQI